MKEFPAAEMCRTPADVFEAAIAAPVAITKHRKPRFVVMSMERFERLTNAQTTQVALSVADMPNDLGELLDQGIQEHFSGD